MKKQSNIDEIGITVETINKDRNGNIRVEHNEKRKGAAELFLYSANGKLKGKE